MAGLKVVELANIGPTGHAAMVLADLGADVVRVQRPGDGGGTPLHMLRGRRLITADLKNPAAIADVVALATRADVLLEGFRPGVAERLGLGPGDLLPRNPRLVFARLTGWGQDGPRSGAAGHDINFIAPTGILHSMGSADSRPTPPLNLVAGFAGGSMFAVTGILSALWERNTSGQGQVIDVSMAEGALILSQQAWTLRPSGYWSDIRGTNLVDGSCPFWDTYECSDGRYMAVGAFEPQFYSRFLTTLDIDQAAAPAQYDRDAWPALRTMIANRFQRKPRDQWAQIFATVDCCVTPVLDFSEAPDDPQFRHRDSIIEFEGVTQPAAAPRFSRTPSPPPTLPVHERSIHGVWAGDED
ncbi:carnitine dehydratase [Williamsia sp. 1138]|uniref:CaiB/BaiF CoA transferase family protein n=1 Tax=Williamsia TaxID=85043 RepID=UPI000A11FB02|nr:MULTISPECIES: CaiB/BaiF CoA-transferase family protein [Williamsia]OZG28926.1 carnitine dehydratase [Williamsia sp. 1138]